MRTTLLGLVASAAASYSVNGNHVVSDSPSEPSLETMWSEYWPFQGITTFAHLPTVSCLTDRSARYDIALVGVPFDTSTSYRAGARFGPRAIRAASARQTALRGYNLRAQHNPYALWATIVDCGDIPVTPMDNSLAFKQMTMGFEELLFEHAGAEGAQPARYVALGGDHAVLLPHLRALHELYGKINVVHFDAHLDTWKPDKYPSFWHTEQSEVNHGSMLWKAYTEGLTLDHNVHAGLRTRLSGPLDNADDDEQGFLRIGADDIWIHGVEHVVQRILRRIPTNEPTYISVDVDVLDPGFTSGTGTQEPGGWLPRELIYVLRRLELLSVVGADVVEVNPSFDHAETTSTIGAQCAYEILTSMTKKGPLSLDVNRLPKRTTVRPPSEDPKHPVDDAPLDAEREHLQQQLDELETLRERYAVELKQLNRLQLLNQRLT